MPSAFKELLAHRRRNRGSGGGGRGGQGPPNIFPSSLYIMVMHWTPALNSILRPRRSSLRHCLFKLWSIMKQCIQVKDCVAERGYEPVYARNGWQLVHWPLHCFQYHNTSYLKVVCWVGEHQHRLAHQCSPCENFYFTHIVWSLNIMEIWEWGIYGL